MNGPETINAPATGRCRADPTAHRIVAAVCFIASIGVLLVASYLTPTLGLHEAVGWPRCGFKLTAGLPCATCGMTTAFTYATGGDLLGAFRVQPAGAILALLTAMLAILSGYALVSGMSLAPLGRTIWTPRIIIFGIVLLVLAWVYTASFTVYTGACPA